MYKKHRKSQIQKASFSRNLGTFLQTLPLAFHRLLSPGKNFVLQRCRWMWSHQSTRSQVYYEDAGIVGNRRRQDNTCVCVSLLIKSPSNLPAFHADPALTSNARQPVPFPAAARGGRGGPRPTYGTSLSCARCAGECKTVSWYAVLSVTLETPRHTFPCMREEKKRKEKEKRKREKRKRKQESQDDKKEKRQIKRSGSPSGMAS